MRKILWLALLPAVAIGVVPATAASATTPKPSVMVIGDSITFFSTTAIQSALSGAGYRATVDGVFGTEIPDQLPTIRHAVRSQPREDWIVELGTNDVRYNRHWQRSYNAEVRTLRGQPCVVLVTVNQHIGQSAVAFDNDIAATVATHHAFHSLDWGAIEWNNPAWLRSDGIHPTSAGSAELAQLEVQALNTDCAA